MINKKVREGFNKQIQHEFYSAYLYLSMAAWAYSKGMDGMAQWFVDEQVEEEANASKNVQNLEMVGDSGNGLLMVDRELGSRAFTMPAPKEEGGE